MSSGSRNLRKYVSRLLTHFAEKKERARSGETDTIHRSSIVRKGKKETSLVRNKNGENHRETGRVGDDNRRHPFGTSSGPRDYLSIDDHRSAVQKAAPTISLLPPACRVPGMLHTAS